MARAPPAAASGRPYGRPAPFQAIDPPLLIIVTGPPASGKTTIAEGLAERLRLPLITKDDFKEVLFDTVGTGDREWSRTLGTASLEILFLVAERILRAGHPLIVESNFWRSHATARFRALPPHRLVQIHVAAPAETLVERYRSRERHAGHLGASVAAEIAPGLEAGEWLPLDLDGDVIAVDTSGPVDLDEVASRIG